MKSNPSRDLSLVVVDTRYHGLAKLAVERSISRMDFKDVFVFSNRDLKIAGSKFIAIEPFSSKERYNSLILNAIPEHLKSSHILIIQYDGFILDPSLWEDAFLDTDYIGAPWPNFPFHCVGNGGFSLRSKKLVDAVKELSIHRANEDPEDVFICRTLRPILEYATDCKFASEELSLRFSFESPSHPKWAFGFHGVLNLAIAYAGGFGDFFAAAPASLLRSRRNELLFGAQFLTDAFKAEFHDFLQRSDGHNS